MKTGNYGFSIPALSLFIVAVCAMCSCGPDNELSIMLVFEQQSDIDISQSLWVAALIPKDNTKPFSCAPFLGGDKDPHSNLDVEIVSEIKIDISKGLKEKLILPSVGEGERLFFAETYLDEGVSNDFGCTVATAGEVDENGKQEIVIRLGNF